MLPQGLPERTLGWEVLAWGSQMLAQPDEVSENYKMGDPWVYSDEQATFILWFYAIDEYGKFLYRNAVLERPKGWGKSPLLAAICCTELLGPVVFDGWDADGKPVGKPTGSPLVQIAAISDSQANNTMDLVREMLANGQAMYYYPYLDINLSKVTYPGGKKLEKVTASPRGREGNRATFVVMDETHLWVPAEKGPQLYEALSRNLAKMNRRWVATTNAHGPGEGSVAEDHWDRYQKALAAGEAGKLLFDTREVFVEDIYDPEQAMPALEYVYGDAADPDTGWIILENMFEEVKTSREHVARRFFFNQHVEGHSTWLKKSQWLDCKKSPLYLKRKDKIALGFKGNTIRGAALVGCRLKDKALFRLGWWENANQQKGWEVPFVDVDSTVRKTLEKYDVAKFLAEPSQYQDIVGRWYSDFPDQVEEFWMSNKTKQAQAVEQFESAVNSNRLVWEHEDISRHVLNCHVDEVPQGFTLRQETKYTFRFIFGAQAAVLALEAAKIAIEEGALNEKDSGLYFF